MRLLDCDTLEFKTFNETELPEYAILSHTWGNEEVNYQEMRWLQKLQTIPEELRSSPLCQLLLNSDSGARLPATEESITARAGYRKIRKTASKAKRAGCQYFWIDTCCIDKSSSSELQESINSMYRWYKQSSVCLVYLEDAIRAPGVELTDENYFDGMIRGSRWVTRGWTLQELIAPPYIRFYDKNWTFFYIKNHSLGHHLLYSATGIPLDVLASGDMSRYCVAEKMSWAARRSTTRVEDMAYCLMGIFDISMPMLYGEGDKAFVRLQEHIMSRSGDDSLLAWKASSSDSSTYRGLFARSPAEFIDGGYVCRGNACAMSSTSLGISLPVHLAPFGTEADYYVAYLQANCRNNYIGIILRKLESDQQQYARTSPDSLHLTYAPPPRETRLIYVRQNISIPRGFSARETHSFHLHFHQSTSQMYGLVVKGAWPQERWKLESQEFFIPDDGESFQCVVLLKTYFDACECPTFLVYLEYIYDGSYARCKLIKDPDPHVALDTRPDPRTLLDTQNPEDQWGEQDRLSFKCSRHGSRFWWVEMEPTIRNDRIVLAVNIGVGNPLKP